LSYVSRPIYDYKCFYDTTDIIVAYEPQITHTNTDYTKVIEFQLINKIHPNSELTLHYEMHSCDAGQHVLGIWYLNGVPYTTADDAIGTGAQEFDHDITTPLQIGDILTLYTKRVAPSSCVKSSDHRILGKASVFSRPYVYP
jgi:hypothetical protein